MSEQDYLNGSRAAWTRMLGECLKNLESGERDKSQWVKERSDTVLALRSVCGDFGDNEWDDDDYLADVIEKHLERHLHHAKT